MAPPWLLRLGFRALTARRALRFHLALNNPARAQRATLARILRRVADGNYARHLTLRADDDYAAFVRKVPIVDYDDIRSWIDDQIATGSLSLSSESPVIYEATSGSSGQRKLIPYTPSLLASFNACVVIWAHDLVARGPAFHTGKIFMSVSPAMQKEEKTPTGVPISLPDDAAYLSPRLVRVLHSSFFVPPAIKAISDPRAYRRALATLLVAEEKLEIISVWSPTYLLTLVDTLFGEWDEIVSDLRRGQTGTEEVPITIPPLGAARLDLLERGPLSCKELWPQLKLLSCWTDAASSLFVPALREHFSGVQIQGKGLLATEAPVTLPMLQAPAPVPLLDEIFLELETKEGRIVRLHEARDGDEYSVIITQSGGLLRYRMHDRVIVDGRMAKTPCLRFVGRDDRVSDLVGEKLGEEFVRNALATLLGSNSHCSFVVPQHREGQTARYCCITDHPRATGEAAELGARLDSMLQRSLHYQYARELEQLAPLAIEYRQNARALYDEIHLERGLSWGDIKFEALLCAPLPSGALR